MPSSRCVSPQILSLDPFKISNCPGNWIEDYCAVLRRPSTLTMISIPASLHSPFSTSKKLADMRWYCKRQHEANMPGRLERPRGSPTKVPSLRAHPLRRPPACKEDREQNIHHGIGVHYRPVFQLGQSLIIPIHRAAHWTTAPPSKILTHNAYC